ncbi:hypothetical protein ACOMHN_050551 [Nucella lapillus]
MGQSERPAESVNDPLGHAAWIGLTDLGSEGHFRWIFSHGKARFLAFRPKEPNNFGGSENCVEVVHGRGWNDQPCTYLFYFICEA